MYNVLCVGVDGSGMYNVLCGGVVACIMYCVEG